ncbi:hypothetical protein CBOM_07316 [Ceraceosorus bombacis]|uniref:Uncharacterized protein n=1 Tax=Ceraceosorus bombacis TaxID=401625 RepID=A0A0P1B8S7_9BASI|nr:hypothetical protein CBOM_07316 [Ceraceosorus bombacis]
MAAQLLRQDGVRCMVAAALGFQDDHLGSASRDGGNAQLEAFEKIAQLLSSPPKGMPLQIFLGCIIPQMLQMLSDLPTAPLQHKASSVAPPQDSTSGLLHSPSLQPRIQVPDSHARAIVFALCALHRRHQLQFSSALQGYIWLPFQPSRTASRSQSTTAVPNAKGDLVVHSLHVSCAVRLIHAIISSAPPEPAFISSLLQPVFTQLFTCWSCLHGPGNMVGEVAVDGGMKVILANLLGTYLKLGEASALASLLGANPDGLLIRARDGVGEETLDGDAFHWASAADGLEIRSGCV